jgi:hypothetical protein
MMSISRFGNRSLCLWADAPIHIMRGYGTTAVGAKRTFVMDKLYWCHEMKCKVDLKNRVRRHLQTLTAN